ncbi:MAG: RimK/LysX family protein [Paracoccaceae bacterium]|nr:RimK/LysX family protein [Paracoccaceae bacterium]
MSPAQKTDFNIDPELIGWREIVALPELDIHTVRAKIDTGARTSALHAVDEETFVHDGVNWVSFSVPGVRHLRRRRAEAPLLDERNVKNTSGVAEWRRVIRTALVIGRHRWEIDLSLANRANMEFELILGRTALHARNVFVAPNHSYLLGSPNPSRARRYSLPALTTGELLNQGEEEE